MCVLKGVCDVCVKVGVYVCVCDVVCADPLQPEPTRVECKPTRLSEGVPGSQWFDQVPETTHTQTYSHICVH